LDELCVGERGLREERCTDDEEGGDYEPPCLAQE
jgi:hypothetical protein